jgi:hypothetical protein
MYRLDGRIRRRRQEAVEKVPAMSNARDPAASAETRPSQALRARCSVPIGNLIHETREAWPGLSTYKKFEQLVSLALTVVIAVVIVVVALFEHRIESGTVFINNAVRSDPRLPAIRQSGNSQKLTAVNAARDGPGIKHSGLEAPS